MSKSVPYFSLIVFFASLSAYLVLFVDSSMAVKLAGKGSVLPLFGIASVIAASLFLAAPSILSRIGNSLFFLLLCGFQAIALFLLFLNVSIPLSVAALVVHLCLLAPLGYCLDLFLESVVKSENTTGRARGIFLTAGNAALVISPFIAGSILGAHSLEFIYGLAFLVFCTFVFISISMLEGFKDPVYKPITPGGIYASLTGSLWAVVLCQFILRVFFSWMAILLPLYLSFYLGFSWSQIGIILLISLLPFVLFEAPLGFLADQRNIIRPLVFFGFLLLGGALVFLSREVSPSMVLVIIYLFISRIGAAMIEIGTETHFFKNVETKDEDAIMLFRITQPLGHLTGALLASLILLFVELNGAIVYFGSAMLVGALAALFLQRVKVPKPSDPSCRQSGLRC